MKFAHAALTVGGLGLLPWMPGTWGTSGALLGALALADLPWVRTNWFECVGAVVVASVFLMVRYVPLLERTEGKDPQVVVLDEVAGYALALAFVPDATSAELVAAFFAFRLFDVVKLWPASLLERLPQGWGVALDDLVAGVYTGACLAGVRLLVS